MRGYEATTRTIDGVAILAEELSDILQALDSLNGKKVEFKAGANGYVLTLPEQPSGDDYVVELTLA